MSGETPVEAELLRVAADDRGIVEYLVEYLVSKTPGVPFHWRRWAMKAKCPPEYTRDELQDLLCTALAMLAERKEGSTHEPRA